LSESETHHFDVTVAMGFAALNPSYDPRGSHMTDDERAIRELIATWLRASQAGDTQTVLSLMTDDVIFMVPGREPFGKEVCQHRTGHERRAHGGHQRYPRTEGAR
jgi:hypothetical protein